MKLVFSLKYLYSAIEEGSNLNIERQNEKRMAIYIQELPMDLVCSFDPNSQWISFERIVKEYRPGVTIARLPELENETHVMRVTWSGKSGVLMIAQNAIDAVEDASNIHRLRSIVERELFVMERTGQGYVIWDG